MANKTLENFCYKIYVTHFLVQRPFMWQESTLLSLWCQGQLNSNPENQTNPRSMRVICIHHWWCAYFFWRFISSSSSISIFHLNDNSTIVICYAWMRDLEISRHFSKGWETSSNTTNFYRNTGLTALCKNGSIPSHMDFLSGFLQQPAIKPTRNCKEIKKKEIPALKWQFCLSASLISTHSPVNRSIADTGKRSINVCAINTVFYILTSRRAFCNEFWIDYLPRLDITINLGYICECKILVKSDWMLSWLSDLVMRQWVTEWQGCLLPKPSYQWFWDTRHLCLLHLQHNTYTKGCGSN